MNIIFFSQSTNISISIEFYLSECSLFWVAVSLSLLSFSATFVSARGQECISADAIMSMQFYNVFYNQIRMCYKSWRKCSLWALSTDGRSIYYLGYFLPTNDSVSAGISTWKIFSFYQLAANRWKVFLEYCFDRQISRQFLPICSGIGG